MVAESLSDNGGHMLLLDNRQQHNGSHTFLLDNDQQEYNVCESIA